VGTTRLQAAAEDTLQPPRAAVGRGSCGCAAVAVPQWLLWTLCDALPAAAAAAARSLEAGSSQAVLACFGKLRPIKIAPPVIVLTDSRKLWL
jgi:hypothetical protein